MSYSLNDLGSALCNVEKEISMIVKNSNYDQLDDLSSLSDFDDLTKTLDPDQYLMWMEYRGVLENLSKAAIRIKYLNQPIVYEGTLSKGSDGRYSTADGYTYTCGSGIEAYLFDENYGHWIWVWEDVDYNDSDYYITHYPKVNMAGLHVRRRKPIL